MSAATNDIVFGSTGRLFTVGADAVVYPEVKAAMLRLATEAVDKDIAEAGRFPMGDHTILERGPIEYDYVDPDTGKTEHVGPFYEYEVSRFYSSEGM